MSSAPHRPLSLQIREESNTKIDLPAENSNSETIVITGKRANCEAARSRILSIQKDLVRGRAGGPAAWRLSPAPGNPHLLSLWGFFERVRGKQWPAQRAQLVLQRVTALRGPAAAPLWVPCRRGPSPRTRAPRAPFSWRRPAACWGLLLTLGSVPAVSFPLALF